MDGCIRTICISAIIFLGVFSRSSFFDGTLISGVGGSHSSTSPVVHVAVREGKKGTTAAAAAAAATTVTSM